MNLLLIGPPGVGKAMLAVALGRSAVEAGYRTYYTTAAELAVLPSGRDRGAPGNDDALLCRTAAADHR